MQKNPTYCRQIISDLSPSCKPREFRELSASFLIKISASSPRLICKLTIYLLTILLSFLLPVILSGKNYLLHQTFKNFAGHVRRVQRISRTLWMPLMYMYVTILSWSFRHGKYFTMFKKLFFTDISNSDLILFLEVPYEILFALRVLAQNVGLPSVGIEPTTLRLRVPCSADWANRAG